MLIFVEMMELRVELARSKWWFMIVSVVEEFKSMVMMKEISMRKFQLDEVMELCFEIVNLFCLLIMIEWWMEQLK